MARVILYDPARHSWVRFDDPRFVIQARRLDEVMAALSRVEQLVESESLYAAGFVTYDASPAFDASLVVREGNTRIPLLWFGLYEEGTAIELPPPAHLPAIQWLPSITKDAYLACIDKIKEHIREGDTYQVNFSFKLRGKFFIPEEEFFYGLMAAQPSTHGAFITTTDFAICSASPEQFFALDQGNLEARPMKGTRKRGLSSCEDEGMAAALHHSEKDRAENLMIVDMMRNDIGRIAEIGSVEVPSLFDVERYPTVWQMTSRVRARTSAGITEIFRALFPCASVTGAPKARTMQLITELEQDARNIYTGALGLIMPGRRARFSVAIRTVLIDKATGDAEYGIGGGIVADSKAEEEYAECLAKSHVLEEIRPTFKLFETIRHTPEEGFYLLDEHLARLRSSAEYFGFAFDDTMVAKVLHALESQPMFHTEPVRVKLVLARDGGVTGEFSPLGLGQDVPPVRVMLARAPVDSQNRFLYHKTTHRVVYERALASASDVDDVILWNERGEVTESTIANVVVELDGALYTPPVSCGLLNGTFRTRLLLERRVSERVITTDELVRARKIFLVNSLRLWRTAELTPEFSNTPIAMR